MQDSDAEDGPTAAMEESVRRVPDSASRSASSLFSAVTSLEPEGQGRFHVDLHPGWTVRGNPNGGYLLSILGRAATAVGPHPDVVAASAHYLRPPATDSAIVETELLRAGRSASQVRARLSQDGQVCVESLITTGVVGMPDPYWDRGLPDAGGASFDECPPLVPRTPDGTPVALMDQVEIRLDPRSQSFASSGPSGLGELRGWLSLPGGEGFDSTSLLFAVDSFPPATFDIEFSGWVPTLELTCYVRARPVPGPVNVLQKAQLIEGQRVDEACFVWDLTGRLVAQATQLAGIRLG